MKKKSLFWPGRGSSAGRSAPARRQREFKPVAHHLEGRELLAVPAVLSAVVQYGIPSVFAIGSTGNVSYNFLTVQNGQAGWDGFNLVSGGLPGGVPATAISGGTVLVTPFERPNVFAVNASANIYYDSMNSTGSFNGWSPVGINVGAVSISTGVLPISNSPFVVMINGDNNIFYNSQMSNGAWAGWTPVGVNVGAVRDLDGCHPGFACSDLL